MNTSLKSPRPAFHPAITCSTGTLVLQHAHKGNVQVEKTGEEQRLQNPFASEINGIQAEKKKPAHPTGIELGTWRLLKMLSVQNQAQNELKTFNSRSSNKVKILIFNLCKCRKTP